jgi:hypothetical protein
MNTYEAFLLKKRPLCQLPMCAEPSVEILWPYTNPLAVCERHAQGPTQELCEVLTYLTPSPRR